MIWQYMGKGCATDLQNIICFNFFFAVDSPTQNHYRIARLGSDVRGVCHGDEISYLFKNIYVGVPEENSMELQAIRRFVNKAFANVKQINKFLFLNRFLFSLHSQQQAIRMIMS
jgi:hypothetical protein